MSSFRPAVGPRLKWLLAAVFGLFALLSVNSAYLGAVTFLEWRSGRTLQDAFYLWNFLGHLVLGFALVLPTIAFGALHWRNVSGRRNPRAMAAGIATFVAAIVLLASGVALTRVELGGATVGLRDPVARDVAYWVHVAAPFVAAWLFVLHRLSGRRIKWKVGLRWSLVAAGASIAAIAFHFGGAPEVRAPRDGDRYFEPSLARTATGGFIPAKSMMSNEYCLECHADIVHSWTHSVHATSSFNNPLYAASVRETRQRAFEREGNVRDANFCAGCHDPVPFFSGAFEDKRWDDPGYDAASDPLGRASITCTVCHGIVSVDSPVGNADYTIQESPHYPLAFSDSPLLQWASSQLIKAKPAFHKRTFLKPGVHRSNEFCGSCHKVHLPQEVNDYKWLRGQNHYDPFLHSGRSGFGAQAWYYPERPAATCNSCHMPAVPSDDFAARDRHGEGTRTVLSHAFPSANTAISALVDQSSCAMLPGARPEELPEKMASERAAEVHAAIVAGHAAFNERTLRIDIFGIREGGAIDGALAQVRPELPVLEAGRSYLVEVVVRTLDLAHPFTQGTADSNEAWLFARATSGGAEIGTTGGLAADGALDPWSRTFNAYVIDREGRRIDRRNPQDIFLPLYDHQIPPGSGDVTHVHLHVPEDASAPIELEAEVRYRKFDTTYLRYVFGAERVNDLPVLVLARDRVRLPVRDRAGVVHGETSGADSAIPLWQRWHDYGIGLVREADRGGAGRGPIRQAEEAFAKVEGWSPSIGALALARVQFREGRLEEASASLARASESAARGSMPQSPWTIAYFAALVDKQNGAFDRALEALRRVSRTDFAVARTRGYDFARDTRVWNELAETALEAATAAEGDAGRRDALLGEAAQALAKSTEIDPEQAQAWWLTHRLREARGDAAGAAEARERHAKYKPDEGARDRAVRLARELWPPANAAAEATVIYRLDRTERLRGDLLPGTRHEVPGLAK